MFREPSGTKFVEVGPTSEAGQRLKERVFDTSSWATKPSVNPIFNFHDSLFYVHCGELLHCIVRG